MTYPPVVMTLRQHKVNNFLKLPDVCVLELASSVISAMHPLFKVSPATPTMFYYWQYMYRYIVGAKLKKIFENLKIGPGKGGKLN